MGTFIVNSPSELVIVLILVSLTLRLAASNALLERPFPLYSVKLFCAVKNIEKNIAKERNKALTLCLDIHRSIVTYLRKNHSRNKNPL